MMKALSSIKQLRIEINSYLKLSGGVAKKQFTRPASLKDVLLEENENELIFSNEN